MEILKEMIGDMTTKLVNLEQAKNLEIRLLKNELENKNVKIKQMQEELEYNRFVDALDARPVERCFDSTGWGEAYDFQIEQNQKLKREVSSLKNTVKSLNSRLEANGLKLELQRAEVDKLQCELQAEKQKCNDQLLIVIGQKNETMGVVNDALEEQIEKLGKQNDRFSRLWESTFTCLQKSSDAIERKLEINALKLIHNSVSKTKKNELTIDRAMMYEYSNFIFHSKVFLKTI